MRAKFLALVIIGFCLTVFVPSTILAACHTVTNAGAGAADGSDWNNPFAGLPATLVRGDDYYFADDTYSAQSGYQLDDAESGTLRITLIKATEPDHCTDTGWSAPLGDGQAIFTAETGYGGAILWIRAGFVTINGVSRTSLTTGHGFVFDCSTAPSTPNFCWGNRLDGFDGFTITFTEYAGTGDEGLDPISSPVGIRCVGTSGSPATGCLNLVMQNLYMHGWQDCVLTGQNDTVLFEHSVCQDNLNTPANHGQAWGDQGSSNVTIRYNRFEDIEGTAHIVVLNRSGPAETADSWHIYGNVHYCTADAPAGDCDCGNGIIACVNGENCPNWRVYNNTIEGIDEGSAGMLCNACGDNISREIKNNLWYNITATLSLTLDTAGDEDFNTAWNVSTCADLTGGNDECTLSGTANPFVDSANNDYHLDGDPLPLAGTDTSAQVPGNTTDPDGVTRGADGVWDRGMFEFQAGGVTTISGAVRLSGNVTVQ